MKIKYVWFGAGSHGVVFEQDQSLHVDAEKSYSDQTSHSNAAGKEDTKNNNNNNNNNNNANNHKEEEKRGDYRHHHQQHSYSHQPHQQHYPTIYNSLAEMSVAEEKRKEKEESVRRSEDDTHDSLQVTSAAVP